jgi:CDP-glucose 4,6-dehydratase
MGTANVLEAVRQEACRCAVVVVTSDKCYENREWVHGYRETDPLGGHDVYSMSKGAAELVVESWRRSFFPPSRFAAHGVALASVRAGNVIGGGDWAMDRIVPDTIRSLLRGKAALVRRPEAVRPWQHVLEPLGGYLLLGAHLMREGAERFCEAWNFGPALDGACSVRCLVEAIIASWGAGEWVSGQEENARHEAGLLRLAIEKAHARLAWAPRWGLLDAAEQTVAWYRAHSRGARGKELRELSFRQIAAFTGGYVRSRA